jgi:hypothetical protein
LKYPCHRVCGHEPRLYWRVTGEKLRISKGKEHYIAALRGGYYES